MKIELNKEENTVIIWAETVEEDEFLERFIEPGKDVYLRGLQSKNVPCGIMIKRGV